MKTSERHHVHCTGSGSVTLLFGHGFGCDQTMWRFLTPHLEARYRVVLYDLAGCGMAAPGSYDLQRHGSLHGHADDLLAVIDDCCDGPVIFVGHSVSAMIGLLAANRRPDCMIGHVMVGPSPCYINDGDYVGGFNIEEIDGMLGLMMSRIDEWNERMAPAIMGAPDQPALGAELRQRFQRNDPDIMRHFGRVTFLADHRADLAASRVPTLILQCSDDMIAPQEVGAYLHAHLANSTLSVVGNVGHCPHMSAPGASADAMLAFFARLETLHGTP